MVSALTVVGREEPLVRCLLMLLRWAFFAVAVACLPRIAGAAEKYRANAQGWELSVPSGWKSSEQAGRVLFGSDTEAGLIVAWFAPGATWEQMRVAAAQGIQDPNVSLTPIGEAVEQKAGKHRALAVKLRGMGADGVEIRALAIGVLGESGSVAVLGLTTAEKIGSLSKTVEAMAASIKFVAVKRGRGTALLNAAVCSYSGNDVGSVTRRLVFDGAGTVSMGSESIMGGSLKDGDGNYTGSWGGYSGNQYDASSRGRYNVEGDMVTLVWPNMTETCAVHFRQADGRITELKCGSRLYGASLCE